MLRNACITFYILLSLGCTVGPDYTAPSPSIPGRWKSEGANEKALKPITKEKLKSWWTSFNDPQLTQLIELGRDQNLGVQIAFTRIEQARAERRANRAALYPRVGAVASPAHVDNLFPGANQAGNSSFNYFLAGFDAIWEIDIFGRLHRKLEASTAISDSATEDYREAWVLLTAEIARTYTEYRNLQNQWRITKDNLASQTKTLKLTNQLNDEGVGTRFDVARARAQTEVTDAHLPAIEAQLSAAQHQLEVLIAQKPGTLTMRLKETQDVPNPSATELLTRPAETLELRPDIRRAERDLAAATANQGAAFAELFPKISIAAFAGFQNSDLENLFRSSAFSWASGSSIMQPIFNFGRIRAGIDLADARQQEAFLNYQKTVLDALKEVETVMTQYLKEDLRRQKLANSVKDLTESLRLADLRYQEGISTFLDVLEAQRALYLQELELAESKAQTTQYLIALYKALGGAGQLDVKPPDEPLRPWG